MPTDYSHLKERFDLEDQKYTSASSILSTSRQFQQPFLQRAMMAACSRSRSPVGMS